MAQHLCVELANTVILASRPRVCHPLLWERWAGEQAHLGSRCRCPDQLFVLPGRLLGRLRHILFNSRLRRLNRLLHEFPLHEVSPVSECAALIEIHVVPLLGFELDPELTVKDE